MKKVCKTFYPIGEMKQPTNNIAREIGIVIPTMNRSHFLERLLEYYARMHFPGPIYIGDSSNKEHLDKTKSVLSKFRDSLWITYEECPSLSEPKTTVQLLSQVTTPYAVYVGDDDFLIPEGLVQCASFLEKSPSFSVCSGEAVLVSINKESSELKSGSYGTHRDLVCETAGNRFLNYMDSYFVNAFSVHRTEQMKDAYRGIDILPDKAFTELLSCCFPVLQGKIKKLDCLTLVRQHHENRYLPLNGYDWLTNENWFPSYQQFAKRLTSILSEKDNISIEQAHEIIKKGFWQYLNRVLFSKWVHTYGVPSLKKRLKTSMKKFPLGIQFWRKFYSYMPGGNKTLPALLRPSSPHHSAFSAVYKAMTYRS